MVTVLYIGTLLGDGKKGKAGQSWAKLLQVPRMNGTSMRCVEASVSFFFGPNRKDRKAARGASLYQDHAIHATKLYSNQKAQKALFSIEILRDFDSRSSFFLQCHVSCDVTGHSTTILLHFRV